MVWVLNVEVWVCCAEQQFLSDPSSRRKAGVQQHLAVLSQRVGGKHLPSKQNTPGSTEHAAHGPASETFSSHALQHSGTVLT